MSLKLLHIADVHLDAPFRWLGARGKEQRKQLRETFRAVVDLALQERVDAFLVAGDLFDSNSPSQDAVDVVQAQLRRLDVPVFLLPGTHDCFDEGSIYRKVDFVATIGSHVHVFKGHSQTSVEVSKLGLTVHGRANLTKTSNSSPLRGLTRNPGTPFNVALAHGSLAMPHAEDDFPVAPADIGSSGMNYVALGHWHSYRECSSGSRKACYPGPPELLAEGELGCVLLLELTEGGTRVEQRRVRRRHHDRLEIPLDGVQSVEEVVQRISSLRDGDLILSVTLSGLRTLDLLVEPAKLSLELSDRFFALRIDDRSHPQVSSEVMQSFPDNTVTGQFVRRMNVLIDEVADDPEQRRMRESALQIGVALLQGRKVLR